MCGGDTGGVKPHPSRIVCSYQMGHYECEGPKAEDASPSEHSSIGDLASSFLTITGIAALGAGLIKWWSSSSGTVNQEAWLEKRMSQERFSEAEKVGFRTVFEAELARLAETGDPIQEALESRLQRAYEAALTTHEMGRIGFLPEAPTREAETLGEHDIASRPTPDVTGTRTLPAREPIVGQPILSVGRTRPRVETPVHWLGDPVFEGARTLVAEPMDMMLPVVWRDPPIEVEGEVVPARRGQRIYLDIPAASTEWASVYAQTDIHGSRLGDPVVMADTLTILEALGRSRALRGETTSVQRIVIAREIASEIAYERERPYLKGRNSMEVGGGLRVGSALMEKVLSDHEITSDAVADLSEILLPRRDGSHPDAASLEQRHRALVDHLREMKIAQYEQLPEGEERTRALEGAAEYLLERWEGMRPAQRKRVKQSLQTIDTAQFMVERSLGRQPSVKRDYSAGGDIPDLWIRAQVEGAARGDMSEANTIDLMRRLTLKDRARSKAVQYLQENPRYRDLTTGQKLRIAERFGEVAGFSDRECFLRDGGVNPQVLLDIERAMATFSPGEGFRHHRGGVSVIIDVDPSTVEVKSDTPPEISERAFDRAVESAMDAMRQENLPRADKEVLARIVVNIILNDPEIREGSLDERGEIRSTAVAEGLRVARQIITDRGREVSGERRSAASRISMLNRGEMERMRAEMREMSERFRAEREAIEVRRSRPRR